jgi:hypothetical protein
VTAARFAQGRTFAEWLDFVGAPENLAREGFDIRKFSLVRPRIDWSGYLRDRYAKARLTDAQVAAVEWIAKQPGAPTRILSIAEDWSSDVRRDLPWIARLAEAAGMELRIFTRDGDRMVREGFPDPADSPTADLVQAFANDKNGQRFATVPVAVFFDRDFNEVYRYIEFPAIYHKERLIGHYRTIRPGEAKDAGTARGLRQITELLESPFFDVWARAAVDEILSALHERLTLGAR